MRSNATSGAWWVASRPNRNAKLRLLCFPYAGGNASLFHSWSSEVPDFVEMYALQPPGRANRLAEAPIPSVPEFIERLGPALAPLTTKPFVFFGYSMGSILSFEACLWLRRNGLNLPEHLFVSARRAPHVSDESPQIHAKSDEQFLAEVARLNGTPRAVLEDRVLLELLLPTLRADFRLCETYRYVEEDPLPLPITLFRGSEDEETQEGRGEEWQCHTTAQFSIQEIPGDHFFIHLHEQKLLSLMRQHLAGIVCTGASIRQPAESGLV